MSPKRSNNLVTTVTWKVTSALTVETLSLALKSLEMVWCAFILLGVNREGEGNQAMKRLRTRLKTSSTLKGSKRLKESKQNKMETRPVYQVVSSTCGHGKRFNLT